MVASRMYTGQPSFHTSRDDGLNREDIFYFTAASPFDYLAHSARRPLETHDLTVKTLLTRNFRSGNLRPEIER